MTPPTNVKPEAIDLGELERLAREVDIPDFSLDPTDIKAHHDYGAKVVAFGMAANPSTILSLIQSLRDMEAENQRLVGLVGIHSGASASIPICASADSAGQAEALAALISAEFIGVHHDSQGVVLEDHDWQMIIEALTACAVRGDPDRPRR